MQDAGIPERDDESLDPHKDQTRIQPQQILGVARRDRAAALAGDEDHRRVNDVAGLRPPTQLTGGSGEVRVEVGDFYVGSAKELGQVGLAGAVAPGRGQRANRND